MVTKPRNTLLHGISNLDLCQKWLCEIGPCLHALKHSDKVHFVLINNVKMDLTNCYCTVCECSIRHQCIQWKVGN